VQGHCELGRVSGNIADSRRPVLLAFSPFTKAERLDVGCELRPAGHSEGAHVTFSRLLNLSYVAIVLAAGMGCGGVNAPPAPQQTTQVAALSSTDVQALVQASATSVSDPLVIAVVDRAGRILAVYKKAGAPTTATGNFGKPADPSELAVALARTAAFFSNNQAPLSSRTVRYISGIHFPPGVSNTASAALYGIENTNRGCSFNTTFIPGQSVPPATLTNGSSPGLGVITGKPDVLDSDPTAVNPGGVPLFKVDAEGVLEAVGGVGVVASRMDVAEFAAFNGGSSAGFVPPVSALPAPGAVIINGITLPFVIQTTQPSGTSAGSANGSYSMGPVSSSGPVPEGDLIPERAGLVGGLSAAEVGSIVQNAIATANVTRAVIRLPPGQRTRMVISVADLDGSLLALYRMPDATVFSIDVAVGKARNMIYFNSGSVNPNDLPGVPVGTAVTSRTISFGAQPLFPSGIDGTPPGPFFPLFVNDVNHPCTQGSQPANSNQNGIVFFPGSEGLYRNGKLVGGLGVSGDGVDQDDYVTAGGAAGWEPPSAMRADQIVINNVRLPYQKFPENPTQ
jgi:uncharacterized protein GlcG (DUF336 family)